MVGKVGKVGGVEMELAKVMAKGQVTIPISVRRKLNLKEGDKLIFIERDGNMVIANSAMIALQQIQTAFEGEAERLGLKTEQDVVDLVDDVRREIDREKRDTQ